MRSLLVVATLLTAGCAAEHRAAPAAAEGGARPAKDAHPPQTPALRRVTLSITGMH